MLNKQPLTASTSEPTTKEPHLKERAGKATAEQQRELKKEARRRFEIGPRYTMMTVLGEGAYGVVCSASDG